MGIKVHNLKVAFRNLMKYKLQTLISVLSIAIGIVTLALTHSILRNFQLPPITEEPYYERIYTLDLKPISGKDRVKLTAEIRAALTSNGGPVNAEKLAFSCGSWSYNIPTEFHLTDSTVRKGPVNGCEIDPSYVEMLSLRSAVTGKKIRKLNPGEAIVSEDFAKKVFLDHNPIGAVQVLTTSRQPIPVTIADVYRPLPLNDKELSHDIMYFCTEADNILSKGFNATGIVTVLKEGADKSGLQEEINERLRPLNVKVKLRKISDKSDYDIITSLKSITYLIGCLILIAAIIGYLRMQVQLIWMRRREMSLRVVNGASRMQLFGQIMLETTLCISMAVAISILLGLLFQDLLTDRIGVFIEESGLRISALWPFSLLIGTILTAICAFIVYFSLWRSSRSRSGLAANMRRSRTHFFRNVMLCVQIAICLVFVCSSFILIGSGRIIMKSYIIPEKDRLFKNCLLVVSSYGHQHDQLLEEINVMPEMDRIASFSRGWYPVKEIVENPDMMETSDERQYINTYCTLDSALISLLGIEVDMIGNGIDRSECLFLQRELYDRLMESGALSNNRLTIEGCSIDGSGLTLPVAGTYSHLPYEMNEESMIGISHGFDTSLFQSIVFPKPGKSKALRRKVNEAAERFEPEMIDKGIYMFRDRSSMIPGIIESLVTGSWILGCVSLIICIMGIFSTITLDTRTRQKEVAIRKVNGAKSRDIYRIFGNAYIWMVSVALLVAIPVCVLFNKVAETLVRDILPDTDLSPLWPITLGSLLVIAFVFAIVFLQIHRVMRVNTSKIIAKE